MKYLSIDIETCGLDPLIHPMIEFAAVYDDGESGFDVLPTFRALVVREDGNYNINPYCIELHQELFKEIGAVDWEHMTTGYYVKVQNTRYWSIVCTIEKLGVRFQAWLDNLGLEGKMNVSGKNFEAFDAKWVREPLLDAGVKFRRRVLDPAMLYARSSDPELPDLRECCARAGVEHDASMAHTALYVATLVVKLIRGGL